MTQLCGQTCLSRTSDSRHHGHRHVRPTTGPSIILRGIFLTDYHRRSHRPSAQITKFMTIMKRYHSVPGSNELQKCVIARQRDVCGSQHPFDTHHCGQVGIVGPPTAQAADVDAQVPFPVPDVVGTLGKSSVPLPSRPSRGRTHLLDIDRQPCSRWIIGGINHDILEVVFVHDERFARESRLDHDVAVRGPATFQRNQNNGVP